VGRWLGVWGMGERVSRRGGGMEDGGDGGEGVEETFVGRRVVTSSVKSEGRPRRDLLWRHCDF